MPERYQSRIDTTLATRHDAIENEGVSIMDRWPAPRLRMHARQRGAALLLLVTVLALGAATLLMSGYSPQAMEQRQVDQTQRTLAQSRDALIGFALQHGRLPRPAISAQDGRESALPCTNDADCSGFLPVGGAGGGGGG